MLLDARISTCCQAVLPTLTEDVASGIGSVRNYLLFDAPQKAVVTAPFLSAGHIGTDPEPMTLPRATQLVDMIVGKIDTVKLNADNGYRTIRNFCPIDKDSIQIALQ